jgi:hypothetical protein
MKDNRIDKAADVLACIGDVLFAGAQLSRAAEAGVLAYGEFSRELEKQRKVIDKELEKEMWKKWGVTGASWESGSGRRRQKSTGKCSTRGATMSDKGITQAEIDKRKDRLIAILKKEGNYKRYMRYLKQGRVHTAQIMTEDIIERYGQELKK